MNGKGPWAVAGSILVALITGVTSIVLTRMSADLSDRQTQEVAATSAVARVWIIERFAQYEKELAVEKALRIATTKSCEARLGRLEDRLFRRSGGRRPVAAVEGPPSPEPSPEPKAVAQELERLQSKRPPKPTATDPRVQKILRGYESLNLKK